MKGYVKEFFKRGSFFAWGGPFIMAIVWYCLKLAGVIESLTVDEAVLGVFTMTVMAFIAAGVSVVYQMEKLPKAMAGLIHMAVLYIDYLGFYLINGWIPLSKVGMFTLIFAVAFAIIWLIIYLTTKVKVDRINKNMQNS